MTKNKVLKNLTITGGIIILGLAVTALLFSFQRKMSHLLINMALQNISEVEELYAESLRSKFLSQQDLLKIQTSYFSDIDIKNSNEIKARAAGMNKIEGFKRIALVSSDGSAIDLKGKSLPSMKNKQYFSDTMRSKKWKIANGIELDSSLEPTLTITCPFTAKDGSPAMIAGITSYNILKNNFSTSVFSGQGYSYLIAENGNIILCNKDRKKVIYNVDFFDYVNKSSGMENPELQTLKRDIINQRSGNIMMNGVEHKKIFSYTPLGINGWYIIQVLPYSYIQNQLAKINTLVFVLIGAIAIVILLFWLVVYILSRKNFEITKDNEKLVMANSQAQTLIFEYDAVKRKVDFSGDSKLILGAHKKIVSAEFITSECFKRIHPEDQNILNLLKNTLENGKKNFSAEFRYKNFSNKYIWLKMTGSTIFDEAGKVRQFIGSITNVNSQVLYEQELKNIADKDKLSGLLNKAAMERNVKQYLSAEGKYRQSALIIVDLDNFKDVNDNLGHMTGDAAIKDAAKKISLIFSDRDFLGRFGGDEFCILMRFGTNITTEELLKILTVKASDLSSSLREDYSNGEEKVSVSASIGISIFPDNGSTYEELFEKADSALYEVKQHGKDGFKIFGI